MMRRMGWTRQARGNPPRNRDEMVDGLASCFSNAVAINNDITLPTRNSIQSNHTP